MVKPPCCDETRVRRRRWTAEEDLALVSYIQEHGPPCRWSNVPTGAGLISRTSHSCWYRWKSNLRPGIKRGDFTDQEEQLILYHHARLGNKWSAIASHLPGRTDHNIKNHWRTHLKPKLQGGADAKSKPRPVLSSSSSSSEGQRKRMLQTDIVNLAPRCARCGHPEALTKVDGVKPHPDAGAAEEAGCDADMPAASNLSQSQSSPSAAGPDVRLELTLFCG